MAVLSLQMVWVVYVDMDVAYVASMCIDVNDVGVVDTVCIVVVGHGGVVSGSGDTNAYVGDGGISMTDR